MNLKEWRDGGKFFDYQKHPIFYHLSEPNDEILLVLHGFPASSFDYHKIWETLTDRFSVLAYDLIGYGFSAKPINFDYTTFQQVDILQNLLEHLKIKKVHILAHDYGNTITQELLARDAEKRLNFTIETICMLNGALFPETHRPILIQKLLISPFGLLFGKLFSDAMFKKSLASVFGAETQPTAAELADYLAVFKHNDGKKIVHKLIRYMSEREKYRTRWVGALEKMSPPFLMINGSADPVSGKHLINRFRELFPAQKNIVEIEKVGHFPHLEEPELVRRHFSEFHSNLEIAA